jgi:integrase
MPEKKKICWEKGSLPGIRYYKHETRKHAVKFDRYYSGSYQVNGKRKFIGFGWSSGGWSEKKIWEKINEYKDNIKTGEGPTTLKEEIKQIETELKRRELRKKQKEIENLTFNNFFKDVYLPAALKHKKKYTVQTEIGHFNNWLDPEIGHLSFNKIKPFNLEKIKKNILDAGLAPRTLQHCFATFRQTWNHARINDLTNDNSPTLRVKLPKVENQRLRFFKTEEAKILLSALKIKSRQVHDITLLSIYTGIRAGEIYSLTWGIVDLENDSLLIRDSKGKPRHAYITKDLKNMFEHLYQGQVASDPVFKDRNGNPLKYISKTFDRTIEELGFNDSVTDRRDKATFHTCRHTFASWHVQTGTDLYTVKELLGHSTIQLTERYSHLRPDGLKKAAKDFEKNIAKSSNNAATVSPGNVISIK